MIFFVRCYKINSRTNSIRQHAQLQLVCKVSQCWWYFVQRKKLWDSTALSLMTTNLMQRSHVVSWDLFCKWQRITALRPSFSSVITYCSTLDRISTIGSVLFRCVGVIQGNTKNKLVPIFLHIKFDLFYIFSCVHTFYFTNFNLRNLENSDSTVVICKISVFDISGP